jgi:hypothetical protein
MSLTPCLHECQPRQLASSLWALGRMSQQVCQDDSLIRAAAALLRALLQPDAAVGGAQKPPAATKQQGVPLSDGDTASSAQQSALLLQANAADLGNILWALGRLTRAGVPAEQLLPLPVQHSLGMLEHTIAAAVKSVPPDGAFVCAVMWGFARLRRPVPTLFGALVSRCGSRYLKALTAQQVALLAWCCARLGHHDADLFGRLLWRGVALQSALSPCDAGLLLWATGRLRHVPDERAVAALLQPLRAQPGRVRARALAHAAYGLAATGLALTHARWLAGDALRLLALRVGELQPIGAAMLLGALATLARDEAAATLPRAGAAGGAVLQSSPPPPPLLQPRQLEPLFRELARHIVYQLPITRPGTLYTITCALGALGYYDARLYARIAAATAADSGRNDGALLSPRQALQLLCLYQRLQHPAPALWQALLPRVLQGWHGTDTPVQHAPVQRRGAMDPASLQPGELVQLLAAAAACGSGCEGQPGMLLSHLLVLCSALLQAQSCLSVAESAQLAVGGAWLLQEAAGAAGTATATGSAVLMKRLLQRLVARLASAALSQPGILPSAQLPGLLRAAVLLQQSTPGQLGGGGSGSGEGLTGLPGAMGESAASTRAAHGMTHVGARQLERLAEAAVERLPRWQPPELVCMLWVHTQPGCLFDAQLADAYAEELAGRLQEARPAALVALLRALAAASLQGYSHSRLLGVACHTLHSRLLGASEQQLRAALEALQTLQYQSSPLHRAASRLLATAAAADVRPDAGASYSRNSSNNSSSSSNSMAALQS